MHEMMFCVIIMEKIELHTTKVEINDQTIPHKSVRFKTT